MSKMVARMQKMKIGNLGGSFKHNERLFENHSNKDIDPERSHLNYELTDRERSISYEKQIKRYIEDTKFSKRAIRKDAVLCDEWIITSDKQFFENLTPEQTRKFFESAKNYFAENYGLENIAYASVHLDESTPHMHMGVVPMKDGKLSSKAMFNREELKIIQDELPKYIQSHGFDIQRGEVNSQAKHLQTKEFKEKQELLNQTDKAIVAKNAELGQASAKLEQLQEKLDDVAELQLEQLQEKKLVKRSLDGKLKVDKTTFEQLFKTATKNLNDNIILNQKNHELKQKIKVIEFENNKLSLEVLRQNKSVVENRNLKAEIIQLKNENKSLQRTIKRLEEQVKSIGKKLSLWRKNAKEYMPLKEFQNMLRLANRINPPKISVISMARTVKKVLEKSLF